jgi:hypothetical protein
MRERESREGARMGEGQGAGGRGPERAVWVGLCRAGSRRGAKTHNTHNHRSESDSQNETEQHT